MTFRRLALFFLLLPGYLLGQSASQSLAPESSGSKALPSAPLPQEKAGAPPSLAKTEGPPLELSLADAIAMAQQNSPRLHEASAITQRVTSAARTASAYTNPSIEVYGGHQSARPVPTPGAPGLLQHYAASQTIEIPLERHARQRAARLNIASSRSAAQAVTLSVVADVKHTFYAALHRRQQIQHAEENLHLVEDLRHRVEVEVRVGEKGRLELTRTEAELARAQFAVRSAQLEYANAIALLRVTIAAPANAELDPEGQLESRRTLPPLKELREHVLRSYPAWWVRRIRYGYRRRLRSVGLSSF